MMKLREPIIFFPLYMERVWGGRSLETVYGRELPDEGIPYGESWEMSDREAAQSVVKEGKYAGLTLNELWRNHREEVFGPGMPETARFPLLIKILDAQSDLSVQVHPPAGVAEKLGGEAKTEMWYIAEVKPEGKLYVGVKQGVSREQFQRAITNGTVQNCIHALAPRAGQSIHIDSGRLHSIGAGLLIYEIQQNSDTTYRVFDWNRMGLDGKPRQLHVEESMQCIDFSDVEPEMDAPVGSRISSCPYFQVDKYQAENGQEVRQKNSERFAVITLISGELEWGEGSLFQAGDFFLLPVGATPLLARGEVEYLETVIPE